MIPEAIEFFNMSQTEDYSCLSIEGLHKNKLLNHALNATTNLVNIEENGVKLGRALLSINDEGDISVFPVYKYEIDADIPHLHELLKGFAKEYKEHMGLEMNTKNINNYNPSSVFLLPDYYDTPIAVI